jgi:surfeit locus 1 family protein
VQRRDAALLILGSAAVLGCFRLGMWQLDRLEQRRAFNRSVAERLAAAAVPLERLVLDTTARFRRVHVRGAFDYAEEIVHTSRVRRGVPGVHILTPLRRPGNDTAILVNRGWVYSPDGIEVDLTRWRDSTRAIVSGWLDRFAEASPRPVASSRNARAVHRLDHAQLRERFPYPIAPLILVWSDRAPQPADSLLPVRPAPPSLGEGSHKSYAFQWFSFGIVGILGIGAYLLRGRRARGSRSVGSVDAQP